MRCARLWSVVLFLIGSVACQAQEKAGPVPPQVLEANRYLIGTWTADVVLDGQPRQVTMTVKPMPDEVGYVIHWKGPGGPGQPDTVLTGVGGWDAGAQVYRELGFATNGDAFAFTYKQLTETTFEGDGTGTYVGKKMQEKVFVDRKTRDEFTWKATDITVGDQRLPDETYYFRRTGAETPYQNFWKRLQGDWEYVIQPLGIRGTASWKVVSADALIGTFKDEDGVNSIELSGWLPATKQLQVHGYGSKGNNWQLFLSTVTPDSIGGKNSGVLPDGRSYEGSFTGKMVDQDHYVWEFEGKTGDGEKLTMSGHFSRKRL